MYQKHQMKRADAKGNLYYGLVEKVISILQMKRKKLVSRLSHRYEMHLRTYVFIWNTMFWFQSYSLFSDVM